MEKQKGLIVRKELLDPNRYQEEMEEQDFILLNAAASLLDISSQTLTAICALYDIEQYRLRTRFIKVRKSSIMEFLDKQHYIGKDNTDDKTIIFDYRGEKNDRLTYVKEAHTEIPQLFQLATFANQIGIGVRRVTRYCDMGILRHYRINSTYKISQADADYNTEVLSKMQFDSSTKRLALKPRKRRATKAEMELRKKQIT